MAIYGAVFVINTSGTDFEIICHQSRRGPKTRRVAAGKSKRIRSIRISRDDWPGNKRKRVEARRISTGAIVWSENVTYPAVTGHNTVLTISDAPGGRYVFVFTGERLMPDSATDVLIEKIKAQHGGFESHGLDFGADEAEGDGPFPDDWNEDE